MSETTEQTTEQTTAGGAMLDGLFAFKVGMSAIFEEGERIPVTILKYEPMIVSQVKSAGSDGYEAVQLAFKADRASQTNGATKEALKKIGFENGAKFRRELRLEKAIDGLAAGAKIDLGSL